MSMGMRRSAGNLGESAFENIIACRCGHGIGGHALKGCTLCECPWTVTTIVDWAINQDRYFRSLPYRADLSAFLRGKRP